MTVGLYCIRRVMVSPMTRRRLIIAFVVLLSVVFAARLAVVIVTRFDLFGF
ncbi:MAG: hypothetical protein GY800_03860 [Planctomycetes bacterium]|nr:hypothetical protein [Planctomycetota bacterium]